MERLAGKVAIVTGGARGMGEATVRLFVEHGARVVIGDVLEEEGRTLEKELGDAACFLRMDVSSPEVWTKAVARALEFGPYNVLVHNAAILTAIREGETGARRDIVVLTAGAALWAGAAVADLAEGVVAASESLESGAARAKLAALVRATQECESRALQESGAG